MEQTANDMKAKLIKEYMSQFQSNEERLEELRRLMRGEESGIEDFLEARPKGAGLPSPQEMHQALLKGVNAALEVPERTEMNPLGGSGAEERKAKEMKKEQ